MKKSNKCKIAIILSACMMLLNVMPAYAVQLTEEASESTQITEEAQTTEETQITEEAQAIEESSEIEFNSEEVKPEDVNEDGIISKQDIEETEVIEATEETEVTEGVEATEEAEEAKENILGNSAPELPEAEPDTGDGLHVKFNHHYIAFPEASDSITVYLSEEPYNATGSITLKRNENDIVDTVIIDSVCLYKDNFQKVSGEEKQAGLLIDSTKSDAYTIEFKGDTNILYSNADGTQGDEVTVDGIMALVGQGSTVNFIGHNTPLKLNTFNAQEYKIAYDGVGGMTKLYFDNMDVTACTNDAYSFFAYATKEYYTNCSFDIRTKENLCMILGMSNEDHDDDEYEIIFEKCNVTCVDAPTDTTHQALGYPSPSAFNCSHSHVTFKNCDVNLKQTTIPVGECRGVYMLHGGITIDGGKFNVETGLEPVDNLDNMTITIGMQAVYVKIKNNAEVTIKSITDLSKRDKPANTCSTWGIIYARNVEVSDSKLDILASGSESQGIYYYGKSNSTRMEFFSYSGINEDETIYPFEIIKDEYYYNPFNIIFSDKGNTGYISRNTASVSTASNYLTSGLGQGNTYAFGNIILDNSDVKVDVRGNGANYCVCGMSSRHITIDYPYESNKRISIHAEASKGRPFGIVAYDFHNDGNLTLTNGAKLNSPENGVIDKVSGSDVYDAGFYTVLTSPHATIPEGIATDIIIDGSKTAPPQPHHGSTSGEKPAFTGTWGNPVSTGTWTMAADGTWSYTTNGKFKNTWGYIVNPYSGNKPDWFYFDATGRMLTGWQWIMGADGEFRCYYLNPLHDGTYGACFIGPAITPDGWLIDASGAWVLNGIAQTR